MFAAFGRRSIPASIVIATAVLLAILGAASGPLEAKKTKAEKVDLKGWIDGPVRYISAKQEAKTFRRLESDEERALFVERFWARRDPSPGTLTNEYRQTFWERVQQANTNFTESTKDGWRTDRGKIYVLYGPPSEIQEDINLETESGPTAGVGLIRWLYDGRPSGRMDLAPTTVVPFVRDVSGEWRLSYDPLLAGVFFDANRFRDKDFDRIERMSSFNSHKLGKSQLSIMLDLGRMQEVPPHEQVLLDRVETTEAYRTEQLEVHLARYRHPDQPGTLVVLSLDLSDADMTDRPAIVARFTPFDATRPNRLLGEDSFRIDEREGVRLAQGRLVLDPGQYTLTVMVAEPATARTSLYRETVTIGEESPHLRFSDVVWAHDLESLRYASLASYDEPYTVGAFRVVPRLTDEFRAGETLKLFFEVYDGTWPLQVAYRLQGREDDGSWVELGQPSSSEVAATGHAWELPTSPRWPPGEYRIRIEIQDAGLRALAVDRPFTLAAPEASDQPHAADSAP